MKQKYNFQVNGLEIQAEFYEQDIQNIFLPLLRRLTQLQKEKERRICVFLAAPPAAGKSTLCCFLEHLSRTTEGLTPVQCVGIDGFHMYQDYLDSHSIMRDGVEVPLAKIKGGPETYRVEMLQKLLGKLTEENQRWPIYDRRIHNPVEEAMEIKEQIIIVEGNWLLLDEEPWKQLTSDYSMFLALGGRDQVERVVRRKMMGGFSEEHAREFVEHNDWPNIQRCMANSRRGDLTIGIAEDGTMVEI